MAAQYSYVMKGMSKGKVPALPSLDGNGGATVRARPKPKSKRKKKKARK